MSGDRPSVGRDLTSLKDACAKWRAEGARLVTTNGCFDVLHAGHIRTLLVARKSGDRLIVGLNSDSSVRGLKGIDRPLVPEQGRAETLAALPFVDWVQIFSEPTPHDVLSAVQPDVHVKGGDYEAEKLPEYELITRLGGRIKIVPELPGTHTSTLLAEYHERLHR